MKARINRLKGSLKVGWDYTFGSKTHLSLFGRVVLFPFIPILYLPTIVWAAFEFLFGKAPPEDEA